MVEKNRRHERFSIPNGWLKNQDIKISGFFGILSGWGACKVKNISPAGMLILTNKRMTVDDQVTVRLSNPKYQGLMFNCKIAHCANDHPTGMFKVGVSILENELGKAEERFLSELGLNFEKAH